jgi:transposase
MVVLPVYINLTDGKVNDAMAAKEIVLPADSVVVADRAYVDFENLYRWHTAKSFFVVRLKKSVKFKRLNELELPKDRHQHILVNEYIELYEEKTKAKYPKKLRRVIGWLGRSKPANHRTYYQPVFLKSKHYL